MPTPDYTADELEAIRRHEAREDYEKARIAAWHAGTDLMDMPNTPGPPRPDMHALRRAEAKGYDRFRGRPPRVCEDEDFPDL